jgi:hypothetical protein
MSKDSAILTAGLIAILFVATAIFGMKPAKAPTITDRPATEVAGANQGPAGWKTYASLQYKFSVSYPPEFEAGQNSPNSVLGTFQEPVSGIMVGPLVFIPLVNEQLNKLATDYFVAYANEAKNPPSDNTSGPSIQCAYDDKISATIAIDYVYCTGEGGPASYALIKDANLRIFVDGYSGGFSGEVQVPPGRMDQSIIKTILSTFHFLQ